MGPLSQRLSLWGQKGTLGEHYGGSPTGMEIALHQYKPGASWERATKPAALAQTADFEWTAMFIELHDMYIDAIIS